ncbi:hypothetical protein [Clostridioides difficile]|uniref:hypothetical protein n=1 Tax=Clostridioides difficile TaxID=1496 RepID=UPI00097AAC99|nr:hypothetical protein [Clostridioides difficile]OMK67360.1 hypothetical protein BER46_003912 [Clostridioides difficile]
MGKYRKKAIIVEAFKWLGSVEQKEEPTWIVEAIKVVMFGLNKFRGIISTHVYKDA